LLGHAARSGKTTLAECMLLRQASLPVGFSMERNTIGDYHELEQEREIQSFQTHDTKWKGYKINIIDTPGYDDFNGEVISALRVADTGVLLLNAAMGVEVGADLIWDYTERFKTPMILAINKFDHDKADFEKTLRHAKDHFARVIAVQYPLKPAWFSAIVMCSK
jgi:elongation factor G